MTPVPLPVHTVARPRVVHGPEHPRVDGPGRTTIGCVESVARCIRLGGWFLRRRDLLERGYTDGQIRGSLASHSIFRVRQGWYSVPDAPADAVRAVRVGGRLTGVAALASYGLRVPRRDAIEIAVPVGACRLRSPDDRRVRLGEHAVVVRWSDEPRKRHGLSLVDGDSLRSGAVRMSASSAWRVSLDDALLATLRFESRDIAVACASAVMHHKKWTHLRMDKLFARAPARARCWRYLVSGLDESHGETFARLWLTDAGFAFESQPFVAGVGRLDGRVSPNVYVEVDGGQHDPEWTGEGASTYESDRARDLALCARGGRTVRLTYKLLYGHWDECLAAIAAAVADDAEVCALRARHPPPRRAFETFRALRKRRKRGMDARDTGTSLLF